jgi:hypothetical protein
MMFRASLLIASLTVATAAVAHDWHHPELDNWYSGLRRPNIGHSQLGFTSCCSKTDCHTTEAQLRENDWWARVGVRKTNGDWELRDWVKVPTDVVLQQQDNPTGEGVICHSTSWAMDGRSLDPKSIAIWCFVPPSES